MLGITERVYRRGRRLLSGIIDPFVRPGSKELFRLDRRRGLDYLLRAPLLAWLNYHQRDILGKQCTWLGHRALKNPMDAWIYQEILYELKADIIIELGNKNGGGALFLASILDLIGHGKVLAVDIDHSRFTARHPRIQLLTGDCSDTGILDKVRGVCAGKRVMVIHDADHSRDAVLRDLRNYAAFVSPGSFLIVEDTIHGLPGFSQNPSQLYGSYVFQDDNTPLQAVEMFLHENPAFVVDESRERYILTANPRGFLRRIS